MAILKCKMCGGDIKLSADKTFGTCEFCGSTMTFPKVDDEQRAAMFNRGNHFRRIGEFDKALAVYERIVQEDEADAEAHWCCALCRFGIEYVEDPNTFEYLPTCHRASFDSFLEDVDYLAALEHSDGITRRQYQKDAAKIAEVQRGILATSQNEEPFDVFICYKESEEDGSRTRDSLYAQDIYYQLTEQGRRVFFSRITLEDKAGTEYEPYIFAALNSAKVMILVTTSAEHANAVWVKNEWSRFLSLMRMDRSKLLLPCYRDMDPYDLPEALSVLQSYDMSKIGFIQDLIRGVNKVLNAQKPKEKVKETVVIQQAVNANIAPLLKRAFLFLEDGDWQSADDYCEKVLDMDPENGEAYLGKLMTELHIRKREQLKDQALPFDDNKTYQKVIRFGDEKLKAELIGTIAFINDRNERARKEKIYQQACQQMQAQRYAEAQALFDSIPEYKDATAQLEACVQQAELLRQENIYRQATQRMGEQKYKEAKALFDSIPDHRDAQAQSEACVRQAELLRQEGVYQQASRRMEEQKYAEAKKLFDSIPVYRDAAARSDECVRLQAVQRQETFYQQAMDLARQGTEKGYAEAAKVMAALLDYKDAQDKAVRYQEKAEELRKEPVYRRAVKAASYRSMADLEEAARLFGSISGYKDADKQLFICQNKIQELQAKEEAKRLKRQKKEKEALVDEARKKRPRKNHVPIFMGVAAVVLVAVAALVLFPRLRAKPAEAEQPQLTEASAAAPTSIEAPVTFEPTDVPLTPEPTTAPTSTPTAAPTAVPTKEPLRLERKTVRNTIAAGRHTVAVKQDGTVVAVGYNLYGECDVSGWTGIVAVAADIYCTAGLRSDGTVVAAGLGSGDVSGWKDIVAITTYNGGFVGLKEDGTITKQEMDWQDIVAISGCHSHIVALRSDGTVVATGDNSHGECEVSGWTDIVAVSTGYDWGHGKGGHTLGLRSDGTVVATGWNSKGQCSVRGWKDIVAIAAGDMYSVGLRSNGTVIAVGMQDLGRTDVFGWKDIVAIAADSHTIGLKSDGTMVAAGYNGDGQCDVSGWTDILLPDIAILKAEAGAGLQLEQKTVRSTIAAGYNHIVGLKADGTVTATGDSYYGQCDVDAWQNIVSVAAGGSHTVGLKADGTVVAVGKNIDGQCDVSDWTDIVAVAAGSLHTVGLRADGTVAFIGAAKSIAGMSRWRDVVAVAADSDHTVGLKADGTVVATGSNDFGQLDVGGWRNVTAIATGLMYTAALKADGTVVTSGSDYPASGWTDMVAVAVGNEHIVGLKSNGTVVAVGGNDYGQCNVSDWRDIVAIAARGYQTMGLKANGTVVVAGITEYDELDISAWKDIRLPEQ